MGNIKGQLLDNNQEIRDFKCGNASIERTITESYYLTLLKHAYAYKIIGNGMILGYYMLLFRKILLEDCPESIGDYYTEKLDYCTSIHIDYLAINEKYQHRGIGTNVLKMIILFVMKFGKKLPIRLITIDALKEYYDWYRGIGFIAFNEKDLKDSKPTISMYMDCISKDNLEIIKEYELGL